MVEPAILPLERCAPAGSLLCPPALAEMSGDVRCEEGGVLSRHERDGGGGCCCCCRPEAVYAWLVARRLLLSMGKI
eukprot:COSAG01_NODE_2704_length_7224_cov_114.816281_9_plen_76_part_00